ncbi:MAG: pyridoxal-dependent decarboxylase [Bacillota bacterium]
MEKEEFRRYGYEFIDWLADYFEQAENYPVKSKVKPDEIKAALPGEPPLSAEPMEEIFNDFKQIIIPGITHWQHPGWFAYFPANNSPASVLAELLTAGLGAQCMIWQTSPAAAELEEVVMRWLGRMLGLPETMSGVIQDTASTATLCALLTARERATAFEANRSGLKRPLRVYTSEEGHSSIDKAVKIAGYGLENLRRIPTDESYALIPEQLEQAVNEDINRGYEPACVVATTGTTSSAAVDPLREIGEICARHKLWFHVDGAYGGTAALLPEKRWVLEGVEMADSFVVNPHKWMLTNFDCSAYFVKDEELLTRTFEIHPEYLKTGYDAVVKNYRDWGIQLGRRFRALKLWFVIRSYGVEGLQKVLGEHMRLAELFKDWVEADSRFELLAPVNFSLVCFRYKREGVSEEELNRLNKLLLEKVNSSGRVFLTHTSLNSCYAIRMAIGQRTTTEKNIREAWELISSHASSL